MSGWISLHRKILDWEWYDDNNVCRLFIHCLLKANHQPKKWKGIDIDRGQFITSLDKLSKETGLSVSQIRTCIKKLKSTNEIASKSHTQHTVITVVSYDSHQGNDKRDDKPMTNESQTNDKRMTTTNNDNKEIKKINSKAKPSGHAEVQAYFEEKGYAENGIGQKFVDHYDSIGWKRGKQPVKDWKATARTWMTKMKKTAPVTSQQTFKPDFEAEMAAIREGFSND